MSEDKKEEKSSELPAKRVLELLKRKAGADIYQDKAKPGTAKELIDIANFEDSQSRPQADLIERIRPKRKYALTDEAREARRLNAQRSTGPTTAAGKARASRNSWKHGQAAASLVNRIVKPCMTTCEVYESCEFIVDGKTEPGGDCLDREHFLHALGAIQEALSGSRAGLDGLAAVMLANVMDMISGMLEKLQKDDYMVITQKTDATGRVLSEEYKPHPLLFALPKLISDFGFTLNDWNLTPAQVSKNKLGDDGIKTLGELMSAAMGKAGKKKD